MNGYAPKTIDGLPPRIGRLMDLAYDLWWTWHPFAREVYRQLDYATWRQTSHNPVQMLRLVSPERLRQAADDPAYLDIYDAVIHDWEAGRGGSPTWWQSRFPDLGSKPIAYCSAEFALHQSLPIYAGGLGVLAGDHCKEASDLGVPIVGIGFMYPQGYFHQKVSAEGWQLENYQHLDWTTAPIESARTADGHPCVVAVPLGDRSVLAAVWLVRLGRVSLYLLDTNLEENAAWDRSLSARLYGGDRETRLQQEIVLGIGGVRALRALDIRPGAWHLNEGHAAFVALQRVWNRLERGRTFDEALDEVRRTTVFTTHTPVPAGHDAFPFPLVETHLAGAWGSLGQHRERFLALGQHDSGEGPLFNMTALAMRTASAINGVSQLHGEVTRKMWASLWPDRTVDTLPITAITNGIHVPMWISAEMSDVFDIYLGADWRRRHDSPELWDAVLDIPDEVIWRARHQLREFLFTFVRERARRRWTDEQISAGRVVAAGTLLDPNALTIGFARRFTGYKRPDLIFSDPDRLAGILTALRHPVQLVFAGKAHPADDPGKRHIQRVYSRALDPRFSGRIAFVDDYDLHVAHFLVQGCDVWLNTPRKPLEASGTSGMKASLNGTLHMSIGDGWWAEGFTGSNGWCIDGHASPDDHAAADAADAEALYRLLEEEVVPMFYERDDKDLPRQWLRRVKEAIRTVAPRFSARRMLKEYAERVYAPALGHPGRDV